MKKIGWPINNVLQLKKFEARIFEKPDVNFLAKFFHNQLSFNNGSNIKLVFP